MLFNDYLNTKIKFNHNRSWATALIFGIIVYILLVVLEPFGMSSLGHLIYIYSAPFGIVTIIGFLIPFYILPHIKKDFFDHQNWTRIKEFFLYLSINACVAIGNLIIFIAIFHIPFSIQLLWTALWQTLAIGFCLIGIGSLFLKPQGNFIEKSSEQHNIESTQSTLVTLTGSGKNDIVSFAVEDLLYIESDKNYCNIVTLGATNQIRITMTSAEEQLKEYPNIVRCHRAYMVNRYHVTDMDGNAAQGYRLTLDNGQIIPMARSYANDLQFVTNA